MINPFDVLNQRLERLESKFSILLKSIYNIGYLKQ